MDEQTQGKDCPHRSADGNEEPNRKYIHLADAARTGFIENSSCSALMGCTSDARVCEEAGHSDCPQIRDLPWRLSNRCNRINSEKEDGRGDGSPEGALIETLPPAEPEWLRNAQLALVVAQVQFPAILSVQTDQTLLARFQEQIRATYPYLYLGQQLGFSLGPQGVEQQQASGRLYHFSDANRQWVVTLSAGSIALESRAYTSYEDFAERLLRILASAREVYDIRRRTRLGLRYINEFRRSDVQAPEDWGSLINPQLLGPIADEDLSSLAISSYQEVALRLENGSLTLRHGHFLEASTVAPPPGASVEERGPFYLLDLDAYEEAEKDLDDHTLGELLKSYNHTMFQILRWSVQDELFEYLKGHR
jgi:uncharacterized protein (TIGR04255 family)